MKISVNVDVFEIEFGDLTTKSAFFVLS